MGNKNRGKQKRDRIMGLIAIGVVFVGLWTVMIIGLDLYENIKKRNQ